MQDQRQRTVSTKVQRAERTLRRVTRYLSRQPRWQRSEAQHVIREAYEMGRAMGDLERLPHSPVAAMEIGPLFGDDLKNHILQTRRIYADIEDLEKQVDGLFEQKQTEMLLAFDEMEMDIRREIRFLLLTFKARVIGVLDRLMMFVDRL